MSSKRKASVLYPDHRSDLESHGFAPDFVSTAAEQRLMLFTHIIRAFGIAIALVVNAIIFVPFFLFGILPVLIRKRFGWISTSACPPLAPTNPIGMAERSRGIFFGLNQYRPNSPNGDVSPLLLSADSSRSDFAPYGDRATIFCDVSEDFPRLPRPMIGGYAFYAGPTGQVTQPHIPGSGYADNGNLQGSRGPHIDSSKEEGLMMKKTHSVDLLTGTPRDGRGLASGLKVPGHGQGDGNTVLRREKTWENLQYAVHLTSKLL